MLDLTGHCKDFDFTLRKKGTGGCCKQRMTGADLVFIRAILAIG